MNFVILIFSFKLTGPRFSPYATRNQFWKLTFFAYPYWCTSITATMSTVSPTFTVFFASSNMSSYYPICVTIWRLILTLQRLRWYYRSVDPNTIYPRLPCKLPKESLICWQCAYWVLKQNSVNSSRILFCIYSIPKFHIYPFMVCFWLIRLLWPRGFILCE